MSDTAVRLALLERFAETGRAPLREEVAADAGTTPDEVAAAYRRLADAHAIVLAPGTDDVWMANPFSAVETPFRVHVGRRSYWGNCIWDALGIVALLGGTGSVHFPCPDCGEPLCTEVADDEPTSGTDLLVHFAVPAANWWDDIGFT